MGVWMLAGLHALVGAYCYGIILRRIPVNGGEASILRTYFSPALGEIAGWVSFIVGFAASNAASAIGFSAYLQKALPSGIPSGKLAAVSAILTVTALHSSAGTIGIRVQTVMAILKCVTLIGLTLWGLCRSPLSDLNRDWTDSTAAFGPAWGVAIMFSMFAYLGWSAAIYSAGETRDAKRNVPRAMLLGTLIVLLLYLGVNFVLLRHISLSGLSGEKAVLELLVRQLFGAEASRGFSAIVAFALLSSLGASAFLGPRVLHTMLGWYRMNAQAQRADPGVPKTLIWAQAILSTCMILSGTFEQILTVTGFLLGIFPILAVAGLYTRKAGEAEPIPSLALRVAVPVFVAGSLLILVLGGMEKPFEMAAAMGVVFLIFLFRRKNQPLAPNSLSP